MTLKSGEKVILGNTGDGGIKLMKVHFGIFPKQVWISRNSDLLERELGPMNEHQEKLMEPLEVFAVNLREKYYSIDEVQRKL